MRIGIIGRHTGLLRSAIALAEELGHEAVGTTQDAQALAWLHSRAIQALVIGGGVEPDSRQTLSASCLEHGIRPVEVFGPDNLRQALQAL